MSVIIYGLISSNNSFTLFSIFLKISKINLVDINFQKFSLICNLDPFPILLSQINQDFNKKFNRVNNLSPKYASKIFIQKLFDWAIHFFKFSILLIN